MLLGYLLKVLMFRLRGFGGDYAKGFREAWAALPKINKPKFKWRNLPSIRPASGHSDETGIQLPVGFLCLTRAFRRGNVLVYAVLGEKVRTDLQDVVNHIR